MVDKNKKVVNEDIQYSDTDIIEMLLKLSDETETIGDKLRALSTKVSELDAVAIIESLALDSHNLAIDIKDTVETYQDIVMVDDEIQEEDFDNNSDINTDDLLLEPDFGDDTDDILELDVDFLD